MKPIAFLLVAVAALAGVVAFTAPASGHADEEALRSSDQDGLEGSAGFTGFSRVIDVPRRLCPLVSSSPV
jgi:hypothetical protein